MTNQRHYGQQTRGGGCFFLIWCVCLAWSATATTCPSRPTGSCRSDVTTWAALTSAVGTASAGSTIVLCGGSITKLSIQGKILVNDKHVRVACVEGATCTISGAGGHFDVRRDGSITLQSIAFEGATDRSVHLYSGSNTNRICDCSFTNSNSFLNKGSAVMAEEGTNVIVDSCVFSSNSAYEGPGIYSRANSVEVINSIFSNNEATAHGGAVRLSSSASTVKFTGCSFTGNKSRNGPVLAIIRSNQWIDGGGNTASGNTATAGIDCEGVLYSSTCSTFGPVGPVSPPTPMPTPLPPPTPMPTPTAPVTPTTNAPTDAPVVASPSICPARPTGSCVSLSTWSQLKQNVDTAGTGTTITVCGGTVTKLSTDDRILINDKFVRIACLAGATCTIQGGGSHFDVRLNGQLTLQGFTLRDATTRSVHIYNGSNTNKICDCSFINNVFTNKGSAITAEQGTRVMIEGCSFSSNQAYEGPGVFSRAALVEILNCDFQSNTASGWGGAVRASSETQSLTIKGSSFLSNRALKGPAVAVYDGSWSDGGGNSGFGNDATTGPDCNGFFDDTSTCMAFLGAGPVPSMTPAPTLAPIINPTPAPSPVTSPTTMAPIAVASVCPAAPTGSCRSDVATWTQLLNAVNAATSDSTITLCAGTITKQASEAKVFINSKTIRVACVAGATCTIDGGGGHFDIRNNGQITLQGLTLKGATDRSVHIYSGTKQNTVCNCSFLNNVHINKGSAISAEGGTKLIVESSLFMNNQAYEGPGVFSRANSVDIRSCTFDSNKATGSGGAVKMDSSSDSMIFTGNTFTNNEGLSGPAVAVNNQSPRRWVNGGGNTGSGNTATNSIDCDGFYDSTSCHSFDGSTPSTGSLDFVVGKLNNIDNTHGFLMSQGLSIRKLATKGQRVTLTSPQATATLSARGFHLEPDGAAAFTTSYGWAYLSNSELSGGQGGVFALEFDKDGEIINYTPRVMGTRRNCGGGVTPWNTWITCEETGAGQCWQVHPTNAQSAEPTLLGGPEGGNYESFAYDDRDASNVRFFITEDHRLGPVRRFTPDRSVKRWDMIHGNQGEGTMEFLRFLPGNKYEWVTNKQQGIDSASNNYPATEGIARIGKRLYFVSKLRKTLYVLNLDDGTYTTQQTTQRLLGSGGASFQSQPDQIIAGDAGELYFTEDGGSTPGIFLMDKKGDMCGVLQGHFNRYRHDETTGLAFSPDDRRMYFAIQTTGLLFEVTRKDGKKFHDLSCT